MWRRTIPLLLLLIAPGSLVKGGPVTEISNGGPVSEKVVVNGAPVTENVTVNGGPVTEKSDVSSIPVTEKNDVNGSPVTGKSNVNSSPVTEKSNVNSSPVTEKSDVNGSPVTEKFKCGEKEFAETRTSYERCASERIGEITGWLEQGRDDVLISSVCGAVQKLLHNCGDELGWCFTAAQVEETKATQRSGIEEILRRHLPVERVKSCLQQNTTLSSITNSTKEGGETNSTISQREEINSTNLNQQIGGNNTAQQIDVTTTTETSTTTTQTSTTSTQTSTTTLPKLNESPSESNSSRSGRGETQIFQQQQQQQVENNLTRSEQQKTGNSSSDLLLPNLTSTSIQTLENSTRVQTNQPESQTRVQTTQSESQTRVQTTQSEAETAKNSTELDLQKSGINSTQSEKLEPISTPSEKFPKISSQSEPPTINATQSGPKNFDLNSTQALIQSLKEKVEKAPPGDEILQDVPAQPLQQKAEANSGVQSTSVQPPAEVTTAPRVPSVPEDIPSPRRSETSGSMEKKNPSLKGANSSPGVVQLSLSVILFIFFVSSIFSF